VCIHGDGSIIFPDRDNIIVLATSNSTVSDKPIAAPFHVNTTSPISSNIVPVAEPVHAAATARVACLPTLKKKKKKKVDVISPPSAALARMQHDANRSTAVHDESIAAAHHLFTTSPTLANAVALGDASGGNVNSNNTPSMISPPPKRTAASIPESCQRKNRQVEKTQNWCSCCCEMRL
jgi:hypothetical protein